MERCEQETIITINQQDLAEGWFHFYTSREADYKNLLKIIGAPERLLNLRITKSKDGEITGWDCKIPKKYLLVSKFRIREKRLVSEEMKEKLAQRAREAFSPFRTKKSMQPTRA